MIYVLLALLALLVSPKIGRNSLGMLLEIILNWTIIIISCNIVITQYLWKKNICYYLGS